MNYIKDLEEGQVKTTLGTIHYRMHRGKEKMVVMLHGMGATNRVWARLIEFIPEDIGICLIDLLGHGNSDAPKIEYTVDIQARVVEEVVKALSFGMHYIAGHSYGGWIATYYASRNKVAGLIVIDAAGLKEQFEPIIMGGGIEEYKDMLLQAALHMNDNKEYVIKSILDNTMKFQLDDELLKRIRVPTLIVWGDRDVLIPLNYGGFFQARIKGSLVCVVKGAGHEPHFTYPEIVGKAITDFVLPNG